MSFLLFPFLLLILMWLLVIRPQQRRVREREALVAALEPGDRVITAGGMHGTVVALHGEGVSRTARLEVAPGVELTFDARAIGTVLTDEDLDDDPADELGDDEDDEEVRP